VNDKSQNDDPGIASRSDHPDNGEPISDEVETELLPGRTEINRRGAHCSYHGLPARALRVHGLVARDTELIRGG